MIHLDPQVISHRYLLRGSDSKESACNAGDPGLVPGSEDHLEKSREWLPTPVFLPGESNEQRSLAGYSPWGRKDWT